MTHETDAREVASSNQPVEGISQRDDKAPPRINDRNAGKQVEADGRFVIEIESLTRFAAAYAADDIDHLVRLGVRSFGCLMMIPAGRDFLWSYPSCTTYSPGTNYTPESPSKIFSHQFEMSGVLCAAVSTFVRGTTFAQRDLLVRFEVDTGGPQGSPSIVAHVTPITRDAAATTVEFRPLPYEE